MSQKIRHRPGLTGSLKVNTWHYLAPDGGLYLATRNGVSVFGFRAYRRLCPSWPSTASAWTARPMKT